MRTSPATDCSDQEGPSTGSVPLACPSGWRATVQSPHSHHGGAVQPSQQEILDDPAELDRGGGVLQQWVNPVIAPPTAQPIIDLPSLGQTTATLPLTHSSLRQARLVGQAANSFIAVTCPDGSLALLDQHAAHERVRLESLSAQVCPAGQAGPAPHNYRCTSTSSQKQELQASLPLA
ncbi:hypothetical protein WJX84_005844 [Apatococcus fuscideae]|uniref:MutL C-terminal dimerisation domain-containing protein n=1 Tax=Apatococcus fuscideae TaxID=2026836 RepID=A0AAW1T6B6_9CHLO